MNENIFYVYMHVDPDSKEVLYIGMGQGSRAYATKTVKINTTRYGHRSPEHAKHLDDLLDKGYLPHEWITFIKRGLHKQDALLLEKDSIEKYKPKYNRSAGVKHLKFDLKQVYEIKRLRSEDGLFYSQIAEKMGCSPMVAHRIVNDLSPRYKEMLVDSRN